LILPGDAQWMTEACRQRRRRGVSARSRRHSAQSGRRQRPKTAPAP